MRALDPWNSLPAGVAIRCSRDVVAPSVEYRVRHQASDGGPACTKQPTTADEKRDNGSFQVEHAPVASGDPCVSCAATSRTSVASTM